VLHTSVLVRAIRTAWIALDEMQMTVGAGEAQLAAERASTTAHCKG